MVAKINNKYNWNINKYTDNRLLQLIPTVKFIYYTSQMDSLVYCQWSRGSPDNLMSMGTVSENNTYQTLSKWQTNLIY